MDYDYMKIPADLVRWLRDNRIRDLDQLLHYAKVGLATEKMMIPAIEIAHAHLKKEMEERN